LIFWDQDSILLIDYLQTIISTVAIEGHFEGKMLQEGHEGGLVLAQQCPGSLGTCNPDGLPGFSLS
jgi:hypothetical protein